MTKKTVSKSRFPVLRTVAGVLAAGALAWVIVERFDTPAVLPTVADAANAARPLKKSLDKPLWRDLSSSQQVALAPLEPQWDRMEGMRKRKWIEMSSKFASMHPAEQQRVHERMRQWMRLTPEQRDRARENYSKTNRLAQGDKATDWENYKQLSPDQKRSLARSAVTGKPAPSVAPDAPALIVPMPCPPNTTRRGAECIVIGSPEASAPAASAATPPVATPPTAAAPPTAPAAPASAAQAANASN